MFPSLLWAAKQTVEFPDRCRLAVDPKLLLCYSHGTAQQTEAAPHMSGPGSGLAICPLLDDRLLLFVRRLRGKMRSSRKL
jgi:hypothetical protein